MVFKDKSFSYHPAKENRDEITNKNYEEKFLLLVLSLVINVQAVSDVRSERCNNNQEEVFYFEILRKAR